MKKRKVHPPKNIETTADRIVKPRIGRDEKILISFRLFKRDTDFEYKSRKPKWYCDVLEKLKAITELSRGELQHSNNRKTYRFHEINFGKDKGLNRKTFGIGDGFDDTACQFSISKNNGRIIGSLVENVFYVIWLDHDHFLYS